MSFQIAIDPKSRAAARFIGKVRRGLVELFEDENEVTRTQIADLLGVHRSVITRQLNGSADISVGRIAEIAWALGYRPSIEFQKIGGAEGCNISSAVAPAYRSVRVQSSNASANVVTSMLEAGEAQQSVKSTALAI